LTEAEDLPTLPDSPRRNRIPAWVKSAVWERDEAQCVKCGSSENLQFDHVIPYSKGGSDTPRNLQILCRECNLEKSNHIGLMESKQRRQLRESESHIRSGLVSGGCIVSKYVGKWGPYLYHVTKHHGKQTWKYLGKEGSPRATAAREALRGRVGKSVEVLSQ
jgi:hypothetical protein